MSDGSPVRPPGGPPSGAAPPRPLRLPGSTRATAEEARTPVPTPQAPPSPPVRDEPPQPRSVSELLTALRKLNLTFDLFEIQAKILVKPDGDVSVQVINQRTGEVIRSIPPYEFEELANTLARGTGALTDTLA